jgi:hypothetical protein
MRKPMPPPPTYSTFKSHLYSFKMQCSDCKQLIRGSKAIQIGTQLWHPDHFTCHSCGLRLKDKTVFQVSGYNYCLMDYKCKFAPRCEECSEFVLGVKKNKTEKILPVLTREPYILYSLLLGGARCAVGTDLPVPVGNGEPMPMYVGGARWAL